MITTLIMMMMMTMMMTITAMMMMTMHLQWVEVSRHGLASIGSVAKLKGSIIMIIIILSMIKRRLRRILHRGAISGQDGLDWIGWISRWGEVNYGRTY